ncbi:MAG TPA: tetratricopeptide repeat protein [Pyrinomonadaceae bacterium]|nr:tetratricopeptide repeat protein [Pyrinomonadaceae bacterium]
MTTRNKKGQIITFYSYKGGTGRSMALANVAWILASAGKRVLTLDWDLEAPGLHRYFYPFLIDKNLTSSDGLIDFVIKFNEVAMDSQRKLLMQSEKTRDPLAPESAGTVPAPAAGKQGLGTHTQLSDPTSEISAPTDRVSDADTSQLTKKEPKKDIEWYKPYANILRYAYSLDWKFDNGGVLDFIPAGRQGSSYSTRVNSFNWQTFYEQLRGGDLLDLAKERMRSEYDYILIDSRTGVSDTSGICTIQMPDILVICFTLNNQSIEGAVSVAKSVQEQRTKENRRIEIFPVPMRVENAEKIKLQNRKDYAKNKFKLFPNTLPGEKRDKYWGDVPVIYVPYYAYEEILAAFGDNSADKISVLAATEELTSYLTHGEVTKLAPISEPVRIRVLSVYEGGPRSTSPAEEQNRFAESVFEGLSTEDKERTRRVFTRLVRVAQPNEVGGDRLLKLRNREIEESDRTPLRALVNSRLLALEDLPNGGYIVQLASESLLADWKRFRGWVDDDREFLLWRQKLQAKLDEWDKSNRDPGALMSGPPLREAERWLNERATDLNSNEAAYIQSSIEERAKAIEKAGQDKRRWFGKWRPALQKASIVAGILVLLLIGYGTYQIRQSARLINENAARKARQEKAMVHNTVGLEEITKGNVASAIDSFTTAIGIAPDYADGFMNLGDTYRRLGEFDKAIEALTKAINLNPLYPNPYYYRGLAYRSKGNKEKALADFTQCENLANDPYWIHKAKQRAQQLKERVRVTVFGSFSGPSLAEVIKELEDAQYYVSSERIFSGRGEARVRYGSNNDYGNAEDIKELIFNSYIRRAKRIDVFVQQTYTTDDLRISVILPLE